jgi:hypothetical protein
LVTGFKPPVAEVADWVLNDAGFNENDFIPLNAGDTPAILESSSAKEASITKSINYSDAT